MKTLMFVEGKEEAAMVAELFAKIRMTLDKGKGYRDARCFDEAAFFDGRGEAFTDYPNVKCTNAAATGAGDFPYGSLVRIPYGSLVYVYRDIGNGEAVYDAYSFGYKGKFAVEKDIEGDLAGLANLSEDLFPTI